MITKETAYLITNMMEDVIQRGTGQAAKVIGRPIAGKTGTTDEFINAWFIGGAPNLVTGIYVGSRADFEALNAFISKHKIKPVVDRVFEFKDAPAAFAAMDEGEFFGKIVIRL